MQPHRQQPTRLRHSWDSLGKNTGVGCHCLLQCMKVKSESEATQSCPILRDPIDCSPPSSSVHGIFQARVLEWGALQKIPGAGLFFFFNNLFVFDCTQTWLLHGLFSSCGEQGLLSSCGMQASHCGGFSCCGAWAWVLGSSGFSSCGTWTQQL